MEELYTQVEENPDDIELRLVLADHLQGREDPRGELMVCQHALELNRKDEAAAARAAELLAAHSTVWMGPLAGRPSHQVRLTWRIGFVDAAHLSFPSIAESARVLPWLLQAESFRFLQSLSIGVDDAVFDETAIWEVFASHRGPRCLREIRLGPPGRARIPERISARFPRLRQRSDLSWQKVRENISTQKRLKRCFDGAALIAPTPRDETLQISVDIGELLVGLRAELEKGRNIGLLQAMQSLFTAESLDRLATSLLAEWESRGMPPQQRWVLQAAGALGGDRVASFLTRRLAVWSHQRAVQATDLLVKLASPMGLYTLCRLSLEGNDGALENHASHVLFRMAKNRGTDQAGVLDRAVPRDLDDDTRQVFEEMQLVWLSDLMVGGHRLSRSDFLYYVARGPRAPLARRLVWGAFEGASLRASFVVDSDGKPKTWFDEPAHLPNDWRVGLLHPLELTPSDRDAWQDYLDRHGLDQPILQLRRPVLSLLPDERKLTSLTRFATRPTWDRLEVRNSRWRVWESYDARNRTPLYGVELRLWRGRQRLTACTVEEQTRRITRVFNRQRLPFGDFHPILLSELLCALEATATRPFEDADIRVAMYEADNRTHRCVACGLVMKSTQLGISTLRAPQRRAWAHWACASNVAELQLARRSHDVRTYLSELREAARPYPPGADAPPSPEARRPRQAPPSTPHPQREPAGRSERFELDEETALPTVRRCQGRDRSEGRCSC